MKQIVKKIDIHAHASVSGWSSFASDAPMTRLAKFLDDAMLQGKISYDTYYKISRGNAEKLLGLTK